LLKKSSALKPGEKKKKTDFFYNKFFFSKTKNFCSF
jgi:hypothetical protein